MSREANFGIDCTTRDWAEEPDWTTQQLQRIIDLLECKIRVLEGEIKAARREQDELLTALSHIVPEHAAKVSIRRGTNDLIEGKFDELGEVWNKYREEVEEALYENTLL